MSQLVILTLVASAILVPLAIYAAILLWRVRQQRLQLQAQAKIDAVQREIAIAERNQRLYQHLLHISRAVLSGECDLSEGAIRLVKLLGAVNLNPAPNFVESYPALFALYHAVETMPTHEAYRALSRTEQREFDKIRRTHESQHGSAMRSELEQLLVWLKTNIAAASNR